MKSRPSISLFFPAFNEAENLAAAIDEARETLERVAGDYEIIIVDDGSTDRTAEIAEEFSSDDTRIRLVSHSRNYGAGAAVRTGIAAARFDYVFYTDADLQFRIADIGRLLAYAREYKAVIGYRKNRKDNAMRRFNAWGWNMLLRVLFGLKVRDPDCAFKLFERRTVASLNLQAGGAMALAEILIRLQRKGIEWKEVPVAHRPRLAGNPTGAKLSVIARAFREMSRLFFGDLGTPLRKQAARAIIAGAGAASADIISYVFLTRIFGFFGARAVLSKIASFSLGAISGFALNRALNREASGRITLGELARFYNGIGAGLLANAVSMYLLVRGLGMHDIAAAALIAGTSFAWNTAVNSKLWNLRGQALRFRLTQKVFDGIMRRSWLKMILRP